MSAFIPPVTGVYGVASSVVANSFDGSGFFRNRAGSVKRKRGPDGGAEAAFDLTRDFPPLTYPPALELDVSAIRGLLVSAASKVNKISPLLEDGKASKVNKSLAGSTIALFKLVEALVEKAIIPLTEIPARNSDRPYAKAAEPAGTAELREALERAERTSIIFGADLGQVPVANRTTLASNLTNGLRTSAISKAGDDPAVVAEAVRVAADALSCATNVDFLGQSSKAHVDRDKTPSGFCSMPVKLDFEDMAGRIHFERTMREKCGVRATMSLPPNIRAEQKVFHDQLKLAYPDQLIMTRPDTRSLSFIAFAKKDKEPKWNRLKETCAIDPSCMLVAFRGGRPAGADGDDSEAMA